MVDVARSFLFTMGLPVLIPEKRVCAGLVLTLPFCPVCTCTTLYLTATPCLPNILLTYLPPTCPSRVRPCFNAAADSTAVVVAAEPVEADHDAPAKARQGQPARGAPRAGVAAAPPNAGGPGRQAAPGRPARATGTGKR